MRAIFHQSLVLILVAAVAATASAFFHRGLFSPPAPASDETTWAQVAAWQQSHAAGAANAPRILIIDARPADAYRAAHVPGALSLNEARWEQLLPALIEALQNNTRLVVYCDDSLCEASRGVATRLRRDLALGAADVLIVKGGWREWLETSAADAPAGSVGHQPGSAAPAADANSPSALQPFSPSALPTPAPAP